MKTDFCWGSLYASSRIPEDWPSLSSACGKCCGRTFACGSVQREGWRWRRRQAARRRATLGPREGARKKLMEPPAQPGKSDPSLGCGFRPSSLCRRLLLLSSLAQELELDRSFHCARARAFSGGRESYFWSVTYENLGAQRDNWLCNDRGRLKITSFFLKRLIMF